MVAQAQTLSDARQSRLPQVTGIQVGIETMRSVVEGGFRRAAMEGESGT